MTNIYLETYGCQMNVADSETVAGLLTRQGYQIVKTPDEADAILINTCAVREHAEDRVFGRIGELAQHKHARPGTLIGILGCMGQHLKDKLLEKSRFVDLVAGPDSYRRLPELLEQAQNERAVDVRLDHAEIYDGILPARQEGISAWITIQRGCDKVCTFCIVPAVRGKERCVPAADVVREVTALVAEGVREVNLLGQTVNSYKHGDQDFADLLLMLCEIPDLLRIRFTSPYPTDFSDKLIRVMAENPKVARHVHLPLQSASDRVLETARRRYNIREFDDILSKLRQSVPGLAVSTDIIVGFHGEDEEDFQQTYRYMEKARFDFAFMFKYSKRSQTAAWRWEEQISEGVKNERLKKIIDLQEGISRDIQRQFVGKSVEVLVEGVSKRLDGQLFGRTSNFKQVVFPAPAPGVQRIDAVAPGDLVNVRIHEATGHTLVGELGGVT